MKPATNPVYETDDRRWQALVRRDARSDGAFFYAVRTTGVYCRPTCSARRPNRCNVEFFPSWAEAEQAGYRACRRCHPRPMAGPAAAATAVARACRLLDTAEEPLSLAALADAVGLSPFHFHRLFKQIVGITPKAYSMAHRTRRFQRSLRDDPTVTRAMYAAGYGSSSRCYESVADQLGMTPSEYRKGGAGHRIRHAIARCDLGWALVAATARGICAIELGDDPDELRERLTARFPAAQRADDDPEFAGWVTGVLAALDRPSGDIDLPLDVRGTAFQRRVWQALRAVPAGSTATYAEIADMIGKPSAARAVGRACATNPVAVAIPCHRVVRGDGGLGGYRWGLPRKRALLEREAARLDDAPGS